MKKFLMMILGFSIVLVLIILVGVLLPTTPRASKSLLFSKIHKDSLLQNVKSPRLIFVGGSNLSFGLNSKMIRDSLGVYPINTSVHLSIGLIYMLDNTLPYIRSGDTVIVSPEYNQFYGTFGYGGTELLRTILDVDYTQLSKLRPRQWLNIFKFIPNYALTKLDPAEYFSKVDKDDIYGAGSFNEYGDAYKHWNLEKQDYAPDEPITDPFNYSVLDELYIFKQKLEAKGAVLYITFPGTESTSFDNNKNQIMKVENELKKKGFSLLGTPERYKIPDAMTFNSSYHLIKKGVDYRTCLLIGDIRKLR